MIPSRRQAVPSLEKIPSRERLIEKAKERLLRHGLPRLEMSILLALTGASGFLTSFLLLKGGVVSMALRYPVAVMVAYGVFLLLLRIWLAIQQDGWRDVVDVADADMVEMALDGVTSVGRGAGGGFSGGGGSFGGAGSTANFQAPVPLSSSPPPAPMAVRSASAVGKSGGGKGFSFDFDLDEGGFLVLLAVLILAVAVMGAAVYVLWTAPVLLAEVLVDGLIMTGLYRRLRKTEEPTHWLLGAVRRTWIPALAVAILFSFAGHLLQKAVPEARSIGPALKAVIGDEEG
ncbi:MAG TPA: hypothetical protein VIW92_06255 [Thermoanaerobaculia bacterium]